jgi:hypothetical protein
MFVFSNFFKKSKLQSRTMPCQSPIAIDQRMAKCKDDFDAPLQYFGHWDRAGRAFIKNTGTSAMVGLLKMYVARLYSVYICCPSSIDYIHKSGGNTIPGWWSTEE